MVRADISLPPWLDAGAVLYFEDLGFGFSDHRSSIHSHWRRDRGGLGKALEILHGGGKTVR